MLRLRGLSRAAQAAWGLQARSGIAQQETVALAQAFKNLESEQSIAINRGFATAPTTNADEVIASDLEQSTGLERKEVEAAAKGVDLFHEEWLDAPFGTVEKPVAVTSYFSERIVGVPDPYDDSIIWWGHIKEGEPPRQLVEGGEYFVLERLTDDNVGHH